MTIKEAAREAPTAGRARGDRGPVVDPRMVAPELQLVVFTVEGQRYTLPLSAVERVLPMVAVAPLPKPPAVALGVFNLHGQVIPVVDIRRRFGLPSRDYGLNAHLLVARTMRRTVALPVDEVSGVAEMSAALGARPEAVLPRIQHAAGIVALSDGLLFIHDLDAFLSLDEGQQLAVALAEGGPAAGGESWQPPEGAP